MKTISALTRNIYIQPNYIDSNIMKNVFSMLKKKYEKTCSEEDGLILSIDSIIKVDNMISKDSCYVIFEIIFNATVIKPEKGLKVLVKPSYLLSTKGIFGKIHDNISIFVPEINMSKDWKYEDESYKFIKDDKVIKIIDKDSMIDVVITDIKFNSTKYNCVCSLS
jgi:DNA-directed RNA polymerase subunit E'/Rpb7